MGMSRSGGDMLLSTWLGEREILLDVARRTRRSKRAKLKKVRKMRTESVRGIYETLIMK